MILFQEVLQVFAFLFRLLFAMVLVLLYDSQLFTCDMRPKWGVGGLRGGPFIYEYVLKTFGTDHI